MFFRVHLLGELIVTICSVLVATLGPRFAASWSATKVKQLKDKATILNALPKQQTRDVTLTDHIGKFNMCIHLLFIVY